MDLIMFAVFELNKDFSEKYKNRCSRQEYVSLLMLLNINCTGSWSRGLTGVVEAIAFLTVI